MDETIQIKGVTYIVEARKLTNSYRIGDVIAHLLVRKKWSGKGGHGAVKLLGVDEIRQTGFLEYRFNRQLDGDGLLKEVR